MTDRNAAKTERYLPIRMFSESKLIGKRPFQDGAMPEKNALFRAHCQQAPKARYSPDKHRRPHRKQEERSLTSFFTV